LFIVPKSSFGGDKLSFGRGKLKKLQGLNISSFVTSLPSQTKILEEGTTEEIRISKEALFNGVSTRFGPRTREKSVENPHYILLFILPNSSFGRHKVCKMSTKQEHAIIFCNHIANFYKRQHLSSQRIIRHRMRSSFVSSCKRVTQRDPPSDQRIMRHRMRVVL
jgi:hypothetical protein